MSRKIQDGLPYSQVTRWILMPKLIFDLDHLDTRQHESTWAYFFR